MVVTGVSAATTLRDLWPIAVLNGLGLAGALTFPNAAHPFLGAALVVSFAFFIRAVRRSGERSRVAS
jgi:hypothetical protein